MWAALATRSRSWGWSSSRSHHPDGRQSRKSTTCKGSFGRLHRQNDAINTNYMARHKIRRSHTKKEQSASPDRIQGGEVREGGGKGKLGAANNGYGRQVNTTGSASNGNEMQQKRMIETGSGGGNKGEGRGTL